MGRTLLLMSVGLWNMNAGWSTRKSGTYSFGGPMELVMRWPSTNEDASVRLTMRMQPYASQRRPNLALLVDSRMRDAYSNAGVVNQQFWRSIVHMTIRIGILLLNLQKIERDAKWSWFES